MSVSGLPTLVQVKARAEVYKALGQPVRLMVAYVLRDGEQTVSGLAARVPVTLSTLSRHLAVMKKAGIVRERRAGPYVFHALGDDALLDSETTVLRVLSQRAHHLAKSLG